MLWLVTFMILLSVGGTLCDSDPDEHNPDEHNPDEHNPDEHSPEDEAVNCFRKERDAQCDRNSLPDDYPNTAYELRKICRNVHSFASCVKDAKEKCGDETDLDFIRHYLVYLKSICEEDNPLFRVISGELECIAPKARELSFSCQELLSNESHAELDRHLQPYEGTNSTQDVRKCLYFRMEISCYAVYLGHHCGSKVKDAVEEIMVNLYNHPQKCGEMKKVVENFKQFFENLLLAELTIEEKLRRRK